MGTTKSGIDARASEWEIGGEAAVIARADRCDRVLLHLNGGSNGGMGSRLIAAYDKTPGGAVLAGGLLLELVEALEEVTAWETEPDRYGGDLADVAHRARPLIARAREVKA